MRLRRYHSGLCKATEGIRWASAFMKKAGLNNYREQSDDYEGLSWVNSFTAIPVNTSQLAHFQPNSDKSGDA